MKLEKLPETAAEWHTYWAEEIECARSPAYKKFHRKGEKVDKRFKDERREDRGDDELNGLSTNLNLFNSNISMMLSMLYGRTPKVEVLRRFADADDDVSRVAGLMLTRILNTDIEVAGEDMTSVFRNALQDRLLPGLGTVWVRYEYEEETKVTPAITTLMDGEEVELAPEVSETVIADEWTDIEYNHWQDELWSPARIHSEITWKARRSYLTPRKFKQRFPDVDLNKISFDSYGPLKRDAGNKALKKKQAEVWEIWDKDTMKVFWWTESADEILDMKEDFLQLNGFFPTPPPMIANVTTSQFMPKSDYDIAADLYCQINELETRIGLLTESCKLVGLYDASQDAIKRIFNEGVENDLIPVNNWAAFAEKGGISGSIVFLPIKEVAEVIQILTEKQGQKIQQLQQITGMSDVMRGAASARTERVSATADKLETQFGSIRIEALQNEFARWVNDTQGLKVEIISKHYQPYCIIQQSNILMTPDAPFAEQAVQLIKDVESAKWKITVRPETLAIADYAQLKQDRTDFLMGLAQFMQSSAPLLQLSPMALPVLLKLLKWFLAGFRGSNEAEGILDNAITEFEKAPPKQDKPDPAVEKAKADAQLKQQESQQKMQLAQQEFQAEMALKQQELQQDQQQFVMQMQQQREEHMLEMRKLNAEMVAAVREQQAQFAFNVAERDHDLETKKAEAEIKKSQTRNGAE